MTIPLRLLLPDGKRVVTVADSVRTEAWIRARIDHDERRGRSQSDFSTAGLSRAVEEAAPEMRKYGFETHQGGGNVFYVSYRKTGPLVIQSRPLAQRVVRLKFQ